MKLKVAPAPGALSTVDASVHALDDALGDRQPQAGAAELARGGAVGLLEIEEDALLIFRREADAGVAHQEADFALVRARLDDHRDAAGLRELDGVAGEVEQHLAQARGVADQRRRQALVDEGRDLDALGLRARRQQFDASSTSSASANGRASRSSLPASILEKSSISSISDNSVSPEVFTALA